jgi:hypothetical protein
VFFASTKAEKIELKIPDKVFDSVLINYNYHFLTSESIGKKKDARIFTNIEGKINNDNLDFWRALI